jgi:hypothetical protein
MLTIRENKEFAEAILPPFPLDEAIKWINSNLYPSDVFAKNSLEAWAEDAGYKRES